MKDERYASCRGQGVGSLLAKKLVGRVSTVGRVQPKVEAASPSVGWTIAPCLSPPRAERFVDILSSNEEQRLAWISGDFDKFESFEKILTG